MGASLAVRDLGVAHGAPALATEEGIAVLIEGARGYAGEGLMLKI